MSGEWQDAKQLAAGMGVDRRTVKRRAARLGWECRRQQDPVSGRMITVYRVPAEAWAAASAGPASAPQAPVEVGALLDEIKALRSAMGSMVETMATLRVHQAEVQADHDAIRTAMESMVLTMAGLRTHQARARSDSAALRASMESMVLTMAGLRNHQAKSERESAALRTAMESMVLTMAALRNHQARAEADIAVLRRELDLDPVPAVRLSIFQESSLDSGPMSERAAA